MKTECDRCGTCCEQGGPTLHTQDRDLLSSGIIDFADLVTIRQGEMVVQPDTGLPDTTEFELLKFQGQAGQWRCRFYDQDRRSCNIYEHRPQACRLMKCWDTDEVLQIAGAKLLNRFDLINADDPLLPLVRLHDQQCALPDMVEVAVQLGKAGQLARTLAGLKELVEKDLMFRTIAIDQFQLTVGRELFYLGRPFFQLLAPMGVYVNETPEGITLLHSNE
jgi:Fe-S-cluster containining protein